MIGSPQRQVTHGQLPSILQGEYNCHQLTLISCCHFDPGEASSAEANVQVLSPFQLSWLSYRYKLVKTLSVCLCLDVSQGGTNRNRYAQRLLILHAQTYLK